MWRRTKEGGIHSWENGDLDEDGVSFSFNSTPLFGLSAPVLYFVEDGLGDSDSDNDNLTKRLELKINKKGRKKEKKSNNVAARLIDCGERISSYSKEGSNLLGSRFLILQSRMHSRLSVHPPACLSMPVCPPVSVRPSICISVCL